MSDAPVRKRRFIETRATVVEKIRETPDTHSLRLALEQRFEFLPGQFCMAKADVDGRLIPRAYSISSSPTKADYIQLTVRQTPEPTVSKWMNDRQVGDTFLIRGPYGEFHWTPDATDTVFMIGGGSGITPLHAILEYVHDKGLTTPVTLLYSATTARDIILGDRLRALAEATPSASLHITLTREPEGSDWQGARGRLSDEALGGFLPGFRDGGFFLCGAPPFVKAMRETLERLGIDAGQIQQERWS
jgi:ferredoxin-NADP reductase